LKDEEKSKQIMYDIRTTLN